MRKRLRLCGLLSFVGLATVGTAGATSSPESREGGIFRVAIPNLDYVDPALAYSLGGWSLLDTTCARLMTYPDKPPPEGLRLVPEVAAGFPKISRNGKTHTFTLRSSFRFSDGKPVRASAFARAISRTLAPGVESAATQYTGDIVGAADVRAGKTQTPAGVTARGNTLVVRFTHPVVNFPAMTTMPFFCAVPPELPPDPEGVRAFPSAGPYVITEYRPGERVTIRRNRFYKGARPHHVDGFDVDVRPTAPGAVLERVEQGEADWGAIITPTYFEPGRNLAAKFGVNKSQFFVRPGLFLRHVVFNTSRPLFRDNTPLRQAVNFALNRRELARVALASPLAYRLTDQYLPPSLPGFADANIYPLGRPNLPRARALRRGKLRGGKAVLYTVDAPQPVAVAQAIRQQLAVIDLDVEVKPMPAPALFSRITRPEEPWDLLITLWAPDFVDPFSYLNVLFDGQYAGLTNVGRFNSPLHNARMRRAGRLQGARRYDAYGAVDVQLARDAAPGAALNYFNDATLVSKRVGCVVLRPTLDLTAVCLR
jgi:ABC-type oligopeptide transport system substrate-binding subunit